MVRLEEARFDKDVRALNVVQMKVGEKELDQGVVLDVEIRFVKAVSGIQNDVVADESIDDIANIAVVLAVCAKKSDMDATSLQCFSPTWPASLGLFRPEDFRPVGESGGLDLPGMLLPFAGQVYIMPGSF